MRRRLGFNGDIFTTGDITSNSNIYIGNNSNNYMVMNLSTLGSTVKNSSLTSLGTLLNLNVSSSTVLNSTTTSSLYSDVIKALNINTNNINSISYACI